MSSESKINYESGFIKETLNYCRILSRKEKKHSICNELNVPQELLEEIFGVKITDTETYIRLRDIFLEDCEHLLDKYYDKKYKLKLKEDVIKLLKFIYTKTYTNIIDKVVTLNDDPELEQLINLAFYLESLKMSWSQWLICMPSGRKLLFSIFDFKSDNIIKNIRPLIKMLSSVSVLQQYDNIFFREQFKYLFNDIIISFSNYVIDQGLNNLGIDIDKYYVLWISNQITTEAFSYLLITAITMLSSKINK